MPVRRRTNKRREQRCEDGERWLRGEPCGFFEFKDADERRPRRARMRARGVDTVGNNSKCWRYWAFCPIDGQNLSSQEKNLSVKTPAGRPPRSFWNEVPPGVMPRAARL
jgi:hypothetical protein